MLTEAKNQLKISILSIKYAIMREMLNKVTFLSNIFFMILNNASFIIQWIILYSIKDNVGGYTIKQVYLLWGLAASTYGVAHFFFKNAFILSDTINNGKLDSYLIQPKNVLLSAITSDVEPAALGDLLYGYIMLFLSGITISKFILFTILSILGGISITSISIILSSLSFWFQKTDMITSTHHSLMTSFATYPEGIFKGITKIILFTIVPVGIVNYIPIRIISEFNIYLFLIVFLVAVLFTTLSFIIFNIGLKKYSSSNLMIAKM